jgi:hypothetical protein
VRQQGEMRQVGVQAPVAEQGTKVHQFGGPGVSPGGLLVTFGPGQK